MSKTTELILLDSLLRECHLIKFYGKLRTSEPYKIEGRGFYKIEGGMGVYNFFLVLEMQGTYLINPTYPEVY